MEKTRGKRVRCGWGCVPPWSFSEPEEERLYEAYTDRQRQHAVPRLLAAAALLQAFAALVPGEARFAAAYGLCACALVANGALAAAHRWASRARPLLAHVAWVAVWAQLAVGAARRRGDAYDELLGWAVLLQYLTLAAMPFHHVLLLLYSALSVTLYLLAQYYNASTTESRLPADFQYQQAANGIILATATLMGCTAYTASEREQRRAFQDTKRSLRDKLTIERQSKEQERLLLSVLPEHVAVQMRRDLGLIDTQFKKIYMSRHENVSILYADIVGFTAISSTYSAQDLVAILNELFARFDRLAEKYHQLRIKILGDCYYCISGAPVERPDHAVLCVHMGLSMVKAIKYVQQTTNSPVDMRVGIHTGAVLAGVLGQRQWQFDVYSRDVELANKMESSGMAGRVHVSEVTLSFLNDEFEVEPAHGERREEMLRQAGIKTYFIVRVIKPFEGGGSRAAEGGAADDADVPDTPSELKDDDEDSVLSPQDEYKTNDEVKILHMLEEELVNRDDDKELEDATTMCLVFKSRSVEEGYEQRGEACPLAVGMPPLLLLPAVVALSGFAAPLSSQLYNIYLGLMLEASIFNFVYHVGTRYAIHKKKTLSPIWRLTCGFFNTGIFVSANIAPLVICAYYEAVVDDNLLDDSPAHADARRCSHPSYYYQVGAGLLCGTLWVWPIRLHWRASLLAAVVATHVVPVALVPNMLRPRPLYDYDPYRTHNNGTAEFNVDFVTILAAAHRVRHILMLIFIAIALFIYARYSESLERARYSRAERTRAQAEQAADLRRRNQALVHNVLPPHVARHFMGARHRHRDLYSQSYAEVGVLFASMPNFSEFYSEETVNNQGLECLRFLNEVISDFDLLLEDPKYNKDIIKIKTISSTYMAASGLNPTRQMRPSDSVVVRWAHLACLVEFALELQRALTAINEQSFNHFVLRMGVNHGPITAGVIGARKPHYDIWGNTVNVASRMESTGKAGCIQVTEETSQILQQFGYYFEQRGLVAVKGKGQLMTYYLQGKREGAAGVHTDTEADGVRPSVAEDGAGEALLANGGPRPTAF